VTGNLTSRNLHGTEEHFFYDTDGKHLNRRLLTEKGYLDVVLIE
jgi:hypothetical protein